jgi:hypothetical protein
MMLLFSLIYIVLAFFLFRRLVVKARQQATLDRQ